MNNMPGQTIGILGGGQLGRMFVMAADSLGYRVVVLEPDADSPAGRIADEHIHAPYDDVAALNKMSQLCSVISTEFENIPTESLAKLEENTIVRPSSNSVFLVQNRIREKKFLADNGFATAKFFPIYQEKDLEQAISLLGSTTSILKVASLGYDGKGQVLVDNLAQAQKAFSDLGSTECVLEEKVALASEISVILARSTCGEVTCYPVAENHHVNGILQHTCVPANVDKAIQEKAKEEAKRIAEKIDYCGVMAVEFFITKSGELLINEIAPRPHNSGHFTLDACVTSQFEQQVRMICGLPAGSVELLSPCVMFNILGDIWENGEPDWLSLFYQSKVKLHLYGKNLAKNGRKMGHFNCLGTSTDELLLFAKKVHEALPLPLQKY